MANELTTHQGEAPPPTTASMTAASMFQSIMDAVKDPALSVEKAAALLDLQERMIDRQAKAEFFAAKSKVMLEMPRISKDGAIKNKEGKVQSRFATFEAIDKIVRPICNAAGLVYSFIPGQSGNQITVTCELAHVSGHVERYGPMPLTLDSSGAKNATQGAGSAVSYGKRYTLCAALNIVTEGADDDGRSTSSSVTAVTGEGWTGDLLDRARMAATKGTEAYGAFFKSCTNMQRGWLVDQGEHERLKAAAAEHD